MKAIWKSDESTFLKWMILSSLGFHLLAAWLSFGYHHDDEQFQIIEFASAKLGKTETSNLAWEYGAKLRPWFLPGVATSFFLGLTNLGIEDPFTQVAVFRFLSALLGWLSVLCLIRCCFAWFEDTFWRRWAIFGCALIWYLPYLHARNSSENWSASLFTIGFFSLVYAIQKSRFRIRDLLLSGLLMGLAFECRFQVGIMIGAGLVWALLLARLPLKHLVLICTGIGLALILGRLIDHWGYGQWTLTPWNYFRINLLEGKANEFGTSPAWRYAVQFVSRAVPPLSLVFILGLVLGWIYKPRLSLTWVTLPFFLIHCLIAHKEFRFLFPIAGLLPILIVFGYQYWMKSSVLRFAGLKQGARWLGNNKAVIGFLVAFNFVCMVGLSVFPARYDPLVARFIYKNNINTIYYEGRSPLVFGASESFFFRRPGLRLIEYNNQLPNREFYYFAAHWIGEPAIAKQFQCKLVSSSVPWPLRTPRFSFLVKTTKLPNMRLYLCQATIP